MCRRSLRNLGTSYPSARGQFRLGSPCPPSFPIRGFPGLSGPGLVVIDSAEDWIGIFNSSEADQLATQVSSEELSRQFNVDHHVERLNDFIMDVALAGKAI